LLTKNKIQKFKRDFPEDKILHHLSDFFKVFGDYTRIKIIYILSVTEMCVHDIAELLEMEQSAISHQLRKLREARLVKIRRQGKIIFYALDDNHVKDIFNTGMEHLTE